MSKDDQSWNGSTLTEGGVTVQRMTSRGMVLR